MRKLILYSKGKDYFKDILRDIRKSKTKICYISFNKSNKFLREEFGKNRIKNENVFVIDAITKIISKKKIQIQENTKYILNPHRLDEISNEIKKTIKTGHNLIILDSLSNLLSYYSTSNKKALLDFIKSFTNEKDPELLFAVRREDETYPLIEDIHSLFRTYQKEIVPFGFN